MRRVVILIEAAEDIEAARDFYGAHSLALATTAPTHSWPTSKVSRSTTVFIFDSLDSIGCWRIVSLSAFTIGRQKTRRRFVPFLICGVIRAGFGRN